MSDKRRHEYVHALSGSTSYPVGDDATRRPVPDDLEALARLMLDAYDGTIDYDGETIVEARDEVTRYLEGRPLLDCSWLRLADAKPVSASLVAWSVTRECPIVSYVITAPPWKGQGLASDLVARSLASLSKAGLGDVLAVITEGNTPSELLFARAGFRRV